MPARLGARLESISLSHVLILEDEGSADDIVRVLRRAGATSFAFATTRPDAVRQAELDRPGVVVSNVELADGSGLAAVRSIKAALGNIPAIFITDSPEQCVDFEHCVIVNRPFAAEHLAAAFVSLAPA